MNTNTTATVTRETLTNGKFRFRVNGEVTVKGSNRAYEWASLYQTPEGKIHAWLHARQDLAVKGNSDANKVSDLARVGITEITEYAPEENTMTETATPTDMTARQIADALLDAGVKFPARAKKEELLALLDAHLDATHEEFAPAAEDAAQEEVAEEEVAEEKKAEAPKAPRAPRRPEVRAAAEGMKVSKAKNYTVKEVSELLAASPISVNRWVQMGKLAAVKSDPKDGRVVNLIPGASVADFLKGRADRAKASEKAKADKAAAKAERAAKPAKADKTA